MSDTELLRRVPQVDAVLREAAVASAREALGEVAAARLVRDEIDAVRASARRGIEPPDAATIAAAVASRANNLLGTRLRRVINATGVILHTNLGRAPLSAEAIESVVAAAGATPLEYDVGAGERGARAPLAAFLAAALTGAQAAHVVNNNAAALLLVLTALAKDREVVVSRGQLIEIGGEFRLPSIMEASGATLREVGTTNRTHARDYRAAIGERTAMLLVVHPSNYRVVGFTADPAIADLAAIAREADVPLVHDIGSGLLEPDDRAPGEPDARGALDAGANLVCFSGDKLLGGPQAGVIAGDRRLVEACRRHPIARALRADKLTLAALEATLLAHARGDSAAIPAAAMARRDVEPIRARAAALAARIPHATVADGESVTGGGSLPGATIPTALLVVPSDRPAALAAALREQPVPVIVRIESGRVVADLRTVEPDDDATVLAAFRSALGA